MTAAISRQMLLRREIASFHSQRRETQEEQFFTFPVHPSVPCD